MADDIPADCHVHLRRSLDDNILILMIHNIGLPCLRKVSRSGDGSLASTTHRPRQALRSQSRYRTLVTPVAPDLSQYLSGLEIMPVASEAYTPAYWCSFSNEHWCGGLCAMSLLRAVSASVAR